MKGDATEQCNALCSTSRAPSLNIWVVVNIRDPFWVLIIIRHLIFRVPKKGHNFDNYPYI